MEFKFGLYVTMHGELIIPLFISNDKFVYLRRSNNNKYYFYRHYKNPFEVAEEYYTKNPNVADMRKQLDLNKQTSKAKKSIISILFEGI